MHAFVTALAIFTAASILAPAPVQAGCGCEKPAPAPAQIRPRVTYPGGQVSIFGPEITVGTAYRVTFRNKLEKATLDVTGTAILARDLANGALTPQLVVPVPALPPGPTELRVVTVAGGNNAAITIADSDFTVAPAPIAFTDVVGPATVKNQRAAVSRSGVVYLSLNLSGVTLPRVFEVQLKGYPLSFTNKDVLFYNRQGFLMQTLGDGMPGLYTISKPTETSNSDILKYSRHEFNSYFLQHAERQAHAVNTSDPNWHLDGTPHIDHNNLIVAIVARMRGGDLPTPGLSPSFDLSINTYTLFHHGLVGAGAVAITGSASTASYDSSTGVLGPRGDVRSNSTVSVLDQARVDGNATGTSVTVAPTATVTGQVGTTTQSLGFMQVDVPSGIPALGSVTVAAGTTYTLARGSYRLAQLVVEAGGTLRVENALGPVTLYVDGLVVVGGRVETVDPNPEKFALYATGTQPVVLNNDANYNGVVYAPASLLDISGLGRFHGAFVGRTVQASANAVVRFDTKLRGAFSSQYVEPIQPLPIYPIYEPLPAVM